MKTIIRASVLLGLLLAFATPLCAQNPNVAIKFDAKTTSDSYCVAGTLKNLRPLTINVSYVELWVYDAKTCKRVCVTRKVINLKIRSCDTINFELCCKSSSPVPAIYYVRVHHSAGMNEEWEFTG